MFKRGQAESLSFVVGLILFLIMGTIAIYGIKLFLGFERDCFGLLVSNVQEAIKNPGKEISFDCDFNKPVVVYGKDDKYAFKFFRDLLTSSFLISKPQNVECEGKSCICECGNIVNTEIKDPGFGEDFIEDLDQFSCKRAKCVPFDQNLLSHCGLVKITNEINHIDCPLGLGGAFFGKGGKGGTEFSLELDVEKTINLVPVKIKFYDSLNSVEVFLGDGFRVLDFETLNILEENIKESITGLQSDYFKSLLLRLYLQGSKVGSYWFFKSTDQIAVMNIFSPVFLISEKGMDFNLAISVFKNKVARGRVEGFEFLAEVFRLIFPEGTKTSYTKFINLGHIDSISLCFNEKKTFLGKFNGREKEREFKYLLLTPKDVFNPDFIGVYPLIKDPSSNGAPSFSFRSGDLKIDAIANLVGDNIYEDQDSFENLVKTDLEFRSDPKNPGKVCLYDKTFPISQVDITATK